MSSSLPLAIAAFTFVTLFIVPVLFSFLLYASIQSNKEMQDSSMAFSRLLTTLSDASTHSTPATIQSKGPPVVLAPPASGTDLVPWQTQKENVGL
jgi:hypothetical protein